MKNAANKKPHFIVAEISKNWDENHNPTEVDSRRLVSGLFEEVILVNRGRGYRLHSWKFDRLLIGRKNINETIVAVFELEAEA